MLAEQATSHGSAVAKLELNHRTINSASHSTGMEWLTLLFAAVTVWGLCGSVMGLGRYFWSTETAIAIHLPAAPIFAFVAATIHATMFPEFAQLTRAVVIIGVVIVLDFAIVAPLLERSFEMFRSVIGTWMPFGLIFLAAWIAGLLF